jgi:hypothetical protein
MRSEDPQAAIARLAERVGAEKGGLDQEDRDSAARRIRERADRLYERPHFSSGIDHFIASVDMTEMEAALLEIANVLSPETATEPVRTRFF